MMHFHGRFSALGIGYGNGAIAGTRAGSGPAERRSGPGRPAGRARHAASATPQGRSEPERGNGKPAP